jgi:acetylornithine deacetylase/succinyl-diaminopimelate desuccinylase-like protein
VLTVPGRWNRVTPDRGRGTQGNTVAEILNPTEILARLVGLATVSRGSNLALVDWVEDYLTGHGIKTARHWNSDRSKAALLAHAGPDIAGGVVLHNITAADCRFAVEMRVVPGDEMETLKADFVAAAAALQAAMQKVRPEASIHLDRFFNVPPLTPEPHGAAEALVRQLTGANAGGVVSYGTEAGFFQAHGYSAVVCGPGDIAQAHQADEYLELSQFTAGQAVMARLVEGLQ